MALTHSRVGVLFALVAAVGCQPNTTRPPFQPSPEAAALEVRLIPSEATRRLAEVLKADSIPLAKVEQRDAYLESPWFEAATGKPVTYRPVGLEVVRVRAWAERARAYSSQLIVETVYRPLADPSLPTRELEQEVPDSHPVAVKVRAALTALVKKYGGAPEGANPVQTPAETPPPDTRRTGPTVIPRKP